MYAIVTYKDFFMNYIYILICILMYDFLCHFVVLLESLYCKLPHYINIDFTKILLFWLTVFYEVAIGKIYGDINILQDNKFDVGHFRCLYY